MTLFSLSLAYIYIKEREREGTNPIIERGSGTLRAAFVLPWNRIVGATSAHTSPFSSSPPSLLFSPFLFCVIQEKKRIHSCTHIRTPEHYQCIKRPSHSARLVYVFLSFFLSLSHFYNQVTSALKDSGSLALSLPRTRSTIPLHSVRKLDALI